MIVALYRNAHESPEYLHISLISWVTKTFKFQIQRRILERSRITAVNRIPVKVKRIKSFNRIKPYPIHWPSMISWMKCARFCCLCACVRACVLSDSLTNNCYWNVKLCVGRAHHIVYTSSFQHIILKYSNWYSHISPIRLIIVYSCWVVQVSSMW